MQDKGLNKFRTIVDEVSSFVVTLYLCSIIYVDKAAVMFLKGEVERIMGRRGGGNKASRGIIVSIYPPLVLSLLFILAVVL